MGQKVNPHGIRVGVIKDCNLYISVIYKLLVVSCCYARKLLTLKELK